jgi:mRNA-degrading endonuclease RelE of RelBE toxin-antitoxin system
MEAVEAAIASDIALLVTLFAEEVEPDEDELEDLSRADTGTTTLAVLGTISIDPAVCDIERLAKGNAEAIVEAIGIFAATGFGDVKKLRGAEYPTWRLRVGRFRVLYHVMGRRLIISTISEARIDRFAGECFS